MELTKQLTGDYLDAPQEIPSANSDSQIHQKCDKCPDLWPAHLLNRFGECFDCETDRIDECSERWLYDIQDCMEGVEDAN